MHPTISAFPNQEFYGGVLKDAVSSAMQNSSKLRSRYLSKRRCARTGQNPSVLFIHHNYFQTKLGPSLANYGDARVIFSIIKDLLLSNSDTDLRGEDIGVICPYAAQTQVLELVLKKESQWKRFEERGHPDISARAKAVEIKTVDGFQGREKKVIIFSTVRNNSGGHLGFLADRRRMNVALTRAKDALFVVGNLVTLARQKHDSNEEEDIFKMKILTDGNEWKNFVQFILERNLFVAEKMPDKYVYRSKRR
jgi:superfamily I DNA and/or RNA helicase